jgi:hypothetical protein
MYCAKLDGYHYDVAWEFSEWFDGHRVWINNMIMQVTKESTTTTCNLPFDGEK